MSRRKFLVLRGPWKFIRIAGKKSKRIKNIATIKNKRLREMRWAEADVPRPIIWGTRSRQDALPWTCHCCGNNNLPTHHLLVDLPAFACSKCGKPRRTSFRFSLSNLALNDICPLGEIKDQCQTGYCIAFAFTKSAEITLRMRGVLSGECPESWPTLDPYSLIASYILALEPKEPDNFEDIDFYSYEAAKKYAQAAEKFGILDKEENLYKFKAEIVRCDFKNICQTLADGYPLVTGILTGVCFDEMVYGDIYKSRHTVKNIPQGYKANGHMVVLVGAARSSRHDFYYFVNSHGEEFCLRQNESTGTKSGGVGKLRANDVCLHSFRFFRMGVRTTLRLFPVNMESTWMKITKMKKL